MSQPLSSTLVQNSRDVRLDIIRGFAIFTITLNHFSFFAYAIGDLGGPAIRTLTQYGFSSAAELFFMLSGYLIGQIYLPIEKKLDIVDFSKRIWRRSFQLYIYNAILFITAGIICIFASPEIAKTSGYSHIHANGLYAFLQFFTFSGHPLFFGILQYYSFFLLLSPLFVFALQRSFGVSLMLIIAPYVLVQIFPVINLPGGTFLRNEVWNLNPFAWQALFYGAILAGRFRVLNKLDMLIKKHRSIFYILISLLIISVAYKVLEKHSSFITFTLFGVDKSTVGITRVIHSLLVFTTLLTVLTKWPSLQNVFPLKILSVVGKFSLQTFCASIVVNYLGVAIWVEYRSYSMYLLIGVISIVVVAFSALVLQWKKTSAGPTLKLKSKFP